jgi:hypothetical protein
MSGEITILKTLVNDRVLVIDINYIRPIIATAISISGTFDGYVIVFSIVNSPDMSTWLLASFFKLNWI